MYKNISFANAADGVFGKPEIAQNIVLKVLQTHPIARKPNLNENILCLYNGSRSIIVMLLVLINTI